MKAVCAKNATTAADGKTCQVDYYNLDAILSVGYSEGKIMATKNTRPPKAEVAQSDSNERKRRTADD